ncbi:ATP synthase F1 subunit epsilon [Patescibacteria group bacterium]|nr:MAG: ATP synthase F1 subunit epsilon [Patescibacteria group bacterium]
MLARLISPEGVLLDSEVYELVVPTVEGDVSIMPGHTSLVISLRPGVVHVTARKDSDEHDHFAVGGGLLRVDGDTVEVSAETAEHVDSIDEHRAHQALAEAKAALETHKEESDIRATHHLVERNLARLHAVKLRHHRRR